MIKNPAAVAALIFCFLESAGNDNLFVVYGAWFEHEFQLNLVGIGLGTGVIGLAELAGEFATAFSGRPDRFEKVRYLGIGIVRCGIFSAASGGSEFDRSLDRSFCSFFFCLNSESWPCFLCARSCILPGGLPCCLLFSLRPGWEGSSAP